MFYRTPEEIEKTNEAYHGGWNPTPDPGVFAGTLSAPFIGVKHALSTMALAGMESTPKDVLSSSKAETYERWRNTLPDPRTTGAVAQFVQEISSVIAYGVPGSAAGPVGAAVTIGGFSGYEQKLKLQEQGVDPATANIGGAITGAVMGTGALLAPFYGKALATKLATGMGINVALGISERGATHEVLAASGYPEMSEHYKMLDGMGIAVDAALGAAFVGGHKLLTRDKDALMNTNRVVAEQTRTIHATSEGLDSRTSANIEVARQIIEEGRAPHEVIPPSVIDDIQPNRAEAEVAISAMKAFDDLALREGWETKKVADFEPEVMPEERIPEEPITTPDQKAMKETKPELPETQYARKIAETIKEVNTEDGKVVDAKTLLDEADAQAKSLENDSLIQRALIDCVIGG